MLTLLFNGKSTSEQLWTENLTHFQDFSMEWRSRPCHHLMLCNATANSCLGPTGLRSDSHEASVLRHGAQPDRSLLFLSSTDPQVTYCTPCCVSEFAVLSQRFDSSPSPNILCQKDDNHQKRWRDWGEKGQGDVQTKACVRDKVSDKETAAQ